MYRFSYAPQREYPYKWLTPLVAAGGLVAIAIVLFVNIETQSYELVATPTNDISVSQADNRHSSYLPKFLSRDSNMACDYATLRVNSEIFTKNYALPYTIRSVWKQYADGRKENQDALSYREHALNDCNVTSVRIYVNGKYSQPIVLSARSRVGLVIKTEVTCAIEVDKRKDQKTYFSLESTYNYIDDNVPQFLLKNATSSPSLFWGQSLLSLYYLVTSHAYFNASLGENWGKTEMYSAFIDLKRQSTESIGGPGEVLSDDFFHIYCTTEANVCLNNTIPSLSQGNGTGAGQFGSPYPTIWPAVNILGKAMWFTVMTDLGQKNITVPNMLADTNLLANLTSNVTNEVNAWLELQNSKVERGSTVVLDTSLANKSFDPSVIPAPALGVNTSYLSTTYICQKAMLKPLGTRFIAILSSSLILLHTIWNIFWLVFNWIFLGRLQEEATRGAGVHIAGDTNSGDLEEKVGQKASNYIQVNQAERLLD
ncbi:hypothetical protein F4680DRAFT_468783 [Xylaria scruposa]|nr:hypothetical protein F4680DRAFT_468783 [Xylaria scruposa]